MRRWLFGLLCGLVPCLWITVGRAAPASDLAATNISQILAFSSAQAALMLPARVTGIVTYAVRGSRSMFISDGEHGLYAELSALAESVGVGCSVELTGVTREGSYQNCLLECSMRILSYGTPPVPLKAKAARVADGSMVAQWVEMQGRVRSATLDGPRMSLALHTEGYQFRVHVSGLAQSHLSHAPLLDSEVRIKAIVTMSRVRAGTLPKPILEVASIEDLEILQRGMDPFTRPLTPISSLGRTTDSVGEPPSQALRVAGLIAAIEGTQVQIEDDTGRVTVECGLLPPAQVGERAEAVGYEGSEKAGGMPTLVDGQLRVMAPRLLGRGEGEPRFPEHFLPVLSRVQSIRELGESEAGSGYPVRLVGAVTFVDLIRGFIFVQDASAGIFIAPSAEQLTLRLFDQVEVEGFSSQGEYAPIVAQGKFRHIGQGTAPQTLKRSVGELISGHEDGQWVVVETVVREMNRGDNKYELTLGSGGYRFSGWLPYEDGEPELPSLVDASVLVSAVCGTDLDETRQSLGVRLFIPSPRVVQVLDAAPKSTDIPLSKIARLRQFNVASQPGHRSRIAGRVLLQKKTSELLIHDGTAGIRVQGSSLKDWATDSPVEVLGFLSESGGQFVLQDSTVQAPGDRLVIAPALGPRIVTDHEWRKSEGSSLESQLHGILIQTEATLLEHHRVAEDMVFTFEAGGRLMTGLMECRGSPTDLWENRSQLLLTGVGDRDDISGSGERWLRLLLRGPEDIKVLARPPWWSQRWASSLLAILGMAIAWAGGAALSLRRKVINKDKVLAKNAEHQAILEQRFQSMIENANDMIFTFDVEGRILSLNRAGEDFTGYTREEARLMTLDDLTLDPDDERYVAWRVAWMRGEISTRNEWVIRQKEGAVRVLEVTTNPQLSGGIAVAVQGIARDIGERLKLEEELRHSQKMETIGQLAGGVAHDFNNILTIIQGYNRLARMRANHDSELIESLAEVERAADRAAALTRQLLTFGRKQSMLRRVTNLNDLILETSKMLHRLIGENIELRLSCAPDLPMVWVDHGMMEQILVNLVVNARDAMPRGGRLDIRTERFERLTMTHAERRDHQATGRLVSMEVRDTGTGMSEQVRAHIFEPFYTTKPVGQGTGLGLATVYGIVKQHGGWMEVETEIGRGSVFRLLLPVTDRKIEKTVLSADPETPARGSETILLVEDEHPLRLLCERVLSRSGYHVLSASDGIEALEIVRDYEGKLDLLLTDLVMPGGMTGVDLANRLCTERPGLKVLFTSGYGRDEMRDEMMVEGVNFLGKPYQVASLIHSVRTIIDAPLSPPFASA